MRSAPWRRAVIAATGLTLLLAGCTGSPPSTTPSKSATPTGSSQVPGGGTAPPVVPSGAIAPLGTKWDWSKFDVGASYLKSMTPGPTFYELEWCTLEPQPGQLDWSSIDTIVSKARTIKAQLMLKIRTGTCWATVSQDAQFARGTKQKTESSMPKDLVQYSAFVKALVTRYAAQGVHIYAVENEINSPSFWSGSTADYEKLLGAAAAAIRQADPAAKVADPGISSTAYGAGIAKRLLEAGHGDQAVAAWNSYYARRIGTRGAQIPAVTTGDDLTAALALPQTQRNLEYLALAQHLAEAKLVDLRQVHFYESAAAAPLFMDYLKATTPAGFPIEAWEVGQFLLHGSLSTAQRSDEMVKTISVLLAGGIRTVIWLPLAMSNDGPNSDGRLFGLLDSSGVVQTTGTAFIAMSKAVAGAQAVPVAKAGLTGVTLQRGGSTTAYVWSASAAGSTPLTLPSGSTVADPTTGTSSANVVTGASPRQITAPTTSVKLLETL